VKLEGEAKLKKIPKQEYTPEFRELAVMRLKAGQTAGAVAKELGLIEQTLRNWVKAFDAGKLNGPGTKQITIMRIFGRTRLGVNGCQFGSETHHYFLIGKYIANPWSNTRNIPDREISLAQRLVVVDNFPNGKLSRPWHPFDHLNNSAMHCVPLASNSG